MLSQPFSIARIVAGVLLALLGLTVITGAASALPIAGGHCVDLRKARGTEYLVNTCGQCKVVEVERNRPGMDKPTQHSYTLPTGVPLQLSFRGPGDTRVGKEKACDNAASAPPSADDGKTCISFQKSKKTGMVLMNSCTTCRLAIIERVGLRSNDPNSHRPYTLTGSSFVRIRSQGATGARIVRDGPCPN